MEKIELNLRAKKSVVKTEKLIAYYIRCSTEEQAENPEGTIRNQEERLAMTLRLKNGDQNFGRCVGVYTDAGKSGKDMNRAELRRLLNDIERGLVNMVMVTELSRLSRSIKDFSQMWEFMQAHGCGFLSLRESFDSSTAAGEMLIFSIMNFAQFERKQTGERVSANFLARAQRGLYNGGVLPLGYEPDPINRGSLKINEEGAKVVRAAFQSLIEEGSVSKTARWLNQNGYSFKAQIKGGGAIPRSKHFTFDNLYRLLSNWAYAGIRCFSTKNGEQQVKAVWPAIIDENTFKRAQEVLLLGRKQKTGRELRYEYLLSGRIFCGECGCILIGRSANGNSGKVPYYDHGLLLRREQAVDEKSKRCTPCRIMSKKIEDRVWKEVLLWITDPAQRKTIFQSMEIRATERTVQKEWQQKEKELLAVIEKISNLTHRISELPKEVPANSFYDEIKNLSEARTRLETEITRLKQKGGDSTVATEAEFNHCLDRLKSTIEGVTEVPADSKRRIIHALIQKVVVTKNGFQLHVYAGADPIKCPRAARTAKDVSRLS